MPRQSAAALTLLPTGERVRPEPPQELSAAEAAEWRAIVDRMPADWFPRETHPMLIQLCRTVVQATSLAKMIEKLQSAKNPNTTVYLRLLRAQIQLSDSINKLSTKMRISQQSQHASKKKRDKPKAGSWDEDFA